MESIESLLDKYWKGNTTLDEEKIIKEHYANQSGTEKSEHEKSELLNGYFEEIERRKEMKYRGPVPGFSISFNRKWLSLAATIILGIAAGLITLQQNRERDPYLVDDPEKALEIVRNTFQMISNNLDEGKKYSAEINKINRTQQILETNKK